MNVSLPDEMRDFVEQQVRDGSYSTSSEYVRALIRRDQAATRLRALLHEGIESADVGAGDSAYFDRKRKAVHNAAAS